MAGNNSLLVPPKDLNIVPSNNSIANANVPQTDKTSVQRYLSQNTQSQPLQEIVTYLAPKQFPASLNYELKNTDKISFSQTNFGVNEESAGRNILVHDPAVFKDYPSMKSRPYFLIQNGKVIGTFSDPNKPETFLPTSENTSGSLNELLTRRYGKVYESLNRSTMLPILPTDVTKIESVNLLPRAYSEGNQNTPSQRQTPPPMVVASNSQSIPVVNNPQNITYRVVVSNPPSTTQNALQNGETGEPVTVVQNNKDVATAPTSPTNRSAASSYSSPVNNSNGTYSVGSSSQSGTFALSSQNNPTFSDIEKGKVEANKPSPNSRQNTTVKTQNVKPPKVAESNSSTSVKVETESEPRKKATPNSPISRTTQVPTESVNQESPNPSKKAPETKQQRKPLPNIPSGVTHFSILAEQSLQLVNKINFTQPKNGVKIPLKESESTIPGVANNALGINLQAKRLLANHEHLKQIVKFKNDLKDGTASANVKDLKEKLSASVWAADAVDRYNKYNKADFSKNADSYDKKLKLYNEMLLLGENLNINFTPVDRINKSNINSNLLAGFKKLLRYAPDAYSLGKNGNAGGVIENYETRTKKPTETKK
jgi:uncharacterized protein YoxC